MRALGREPTREELILWGRVAHLGVGVTFALAYVPLAKRFPVLRRGLGAVYGITVYPANAVVVPALGLTPPTWEFPVETTIRGLGYHIAYGMALELLARMLRLVDTRA
jgi:uncharacterized membrane protein YagU involved in acid resistance